MSSSSSSSYTTLEIFQDNTNPSVFTLRCSRGDLPFTYMGLPIGSLPLYYFLMFCVPSNVIKQLESIRKNFFWGGVGEGKKLAWVKWDTLLASNGDGGLNIGSLRASSFREMGALGRRGLWRDIAKIGEDFEGIGIDFTSSFRGVVGDGKMQVCDKKHGKWTKNEDNTDSYEILRCNPYDSVTS
ncbi:hypothetical protein Tco_0500994 [Tanacetum coccineum]